MFPVSLKLKRLGSCATTKGMTENIMILADSFVRSSFSTPVSAFTLISTQRERKDLAYHINCSVGSARRRGLGPNVDDHILNFESKTHKDYNMRSMVLCVYL